jgi:hypothetical protein
MATIPTADELRQSIITAYGSLTSPTWHFIQRLYDTRPYDAIEVQLRQHFQVTEDTDLNNDVSVVLFVDGTRKCWVVCLSLVAPYAAVTIRSPESVIVVHVPGEDPEEQYLFDVLQRANVVALPQVLLEEPIGLALSSTYPENVRLYQALFGDYDILPWQSPAV